MAHLYKETVWKSGSGRYFSGDVEDLAHGSGRWWIPCRVLKMAPVDFILLLKNEFNASNFSYNREKNMLLYSWEQEKDANKYKNWINSMAKKANAII